MLVGSEKTYEEVSYNAEANEFIVTGDDKKFTVIENISSNKFIVSDAKGIKYHASYDQDIGSISLLKKESTRGMNYSVASSPRESNPVDYMGSSDRAMMSSARDSVSTDFLGSRTVTVHSIQALLNKAVERERDGDTCKKKGDLQGALSAYRDVLSIIERLARQNSSNSDFQRNLAVSLYKLATTSEQLGSGRDAIKYWKRCHETLRDMRRAGIDIDSPLQNLLSQLEDMQPEAQEQLINLSERAEQHHEHGRLDEALQAYQGIVTIRESLAERDPENTGRQRALSVSHEKVGTVYEELRDRETAHRAYESALEITKRLVDWDPNNADWQRDLVVSHYKIAWNLLQTGAHPEADIYWDRCYATLQLMQQMGMNLDAPLQNLLTQLAAVQQLKDLNHQVERSIEQGQVDESVRLAEHAYDFLNSKSNWGWMTPAHAECINNLGALYTKVGRHSESKTLLLQAIDLWRAILHGKSHPGYAGSLQNLASLYDKLDCTEKAEPLRQEARMVMQAVREPKNLNRWSIFKNFMSRLFGNSKD